MYRFLFRHAHGSTDMLIEFLEDSANKEFVACSRRLGECGAPVLEKEDLWMNDEMIYHMDCPQGRFEVSTNTGDRCSLFRKAARRSLLIFVMLCCKADASSRCRLMR